MISKVTFIAIFIINESLGQTIASPTADTKLMQSYEKFMDAYCVNEDISPEVIRKLDECDAIVFSKEGKDMENECMTEIAPKGSNVNDIRRLWCTNQTFYQKTRQCYSKKIETKQNTGEQISEEQLRNDTIRAMECRKRVFKF